MDWTFVTEACFPAVIPDISAQEFRARNSDAWARNVDFWNSFEEINPVREQIYDYVIEAAALALPKSATVGDFACGSGVFAEKLLAHFTDGQVHGFDRCNPALLFKKHANINFELLDVESGLFPKPFLDAAYCILSAFEFPALNDFFRRVASGLHADRNLNLVVLDSTIEANRIFLDKIPNHNCNLHKLGNRLVLESHFFHEEKKSPAPYYRILYSLLDYIEFAREAGLEFVSTQRVIPARESSVIDPEYILLQFAKVE